MSSFDANTHVFIVRVWCERREITDAKHVWRGVIEHVPSGERRYLTELEVISAFIATYLNQMGVKPGPGGRLNRWLNRWYRRRKSCG